MIDALEKVNYYMYIAPLKIKFLMLQFYSVFVLFTY